MCVRARERAREREALKRTFQIQIFIFWLSRFGGLNTTASATGTDDDDDDVNDVESATVEITLVFFHDKKMLKHFEWQKKVFCPLLRKKARVSEAV